MMVASENPPAPMSGAEGRNRTQKQTDPPTRLYLNPDGAMMGQSDKTRRHLALVYNTRPARKPLNGLSMLLLFPHRPGRYVTTFCLLTLWMSMQSAAMTIADEASPAAADAEKTAPVSYPPAVVEKADKVLKDAGLRRSGKTIQSIEAAELSRLLSSLTRSRRELRLQKKTLAEAEAKTAAIEMEIDKFNRRDGELNLQLARIAGRDVTSNNRLVALINATRTQVSELRKQQNLQTKATQRVRSALNDAEQQYAESVFQARKRIDQLGEKIEHRLQDSQVQIAIDVMHANFDVPKEIGAEQILRSLDHRLRDFEEEVFQEDIPLQAASNGALHTMVSVNQKSIEMVVDSGATLITLPAGAAAKLNITIPANAPVLQLALANGDQITGRRVTLESVRVGQFEAKDVDAVVLEPIPGNAQPLLGLSFLDRYKFELDAAAKSLGLLRIDHAESKSP